MSIYVLIVLCLYVLLGFTGIILDLIEWKGDKADWLLLIIAFVIFITGVIAIIFQASKL